MRVTASRREGYTHDVEIEGGHSLVVDEPEAAGGKDEGPSPTRLLAASLASCVAITVEMYAQRKGWDVGQLEVVVDLEYGPASQPRSFDVVLKLPSGLDEDQVKRLEEIAARCPVHRALADGVEMADRVEQA